MLNIKVTNCKYDCKLKGFAYDQYVVGYFFILLADA